MEPLKPYVWLKKSNNQFNAYFYINVPDGYKIDGLQNPVDDTSTGVRTYKYLVEFLTGASGQIVGASTGAHSQPSGISKISVVVFDVSNPNNPVKQGITDTNYDDADG